MRSTVQRPASGEQSRLLRPASATMWTSLRFFAFSRAVLAVLLLVFDTIDDLARFTDSIGVPGVDRALFANVTLVYLAISLVYLAAANALRRGFHAQFLVQVFTDLVVLTLLMHAAGGPRSGIGVLIVAAVGGAAVLSTPLLAAFFAASATLLALGETAWRVLYVDVADSGGFAAPALVGAACFVTAAVVNRLAMRLAAQEALARQRGDDLHSQLAITRLVISELPQGVVVLDANGRVRTMNRSAQSLLGADGPWPVIDRLVRERAHAQGEGDSRPGTDRAPGDDVEVVLEPVAAASGGGAPGHRVRVRFLHPGAGERSDVVLVIEDQREVEERAQQLKLASMGRLSASIAHEIRNPLAAIRHANGLLAERIATPPLQRLARIVEDNSVRIDRIVEDVLSIARRERPTLEQVDVAEFLDALLPEFAAMNGADDSRIEVSIQTDARLAFDPRHLRLVLVNLVSNALRYASATAGSLRIEWRRGAGDRLELKVEDDGPGLPAEMLEHAFEPFFTTEARGTGLGLYLAREFCSANDATLRYERFGAQGRYRGAFVIVPRAGQVTA